MTTEPDRVPARLGADALALAAELPLTDDEASYVEAARAPNTLRGYRSDWPEFTAWCTRQRLKPLPAGAATISGYLTELARAGAKVGTMSRRLSAIRFAHQLRDHLTRPPGLGWSQCGRESAAPTAHQCLTPLKVRRTGGVGRGGVRPAGPPTRPHLARPRVVVV